MTLQQLRHFLAILETGSLSLAAQRCHISQPSMSASLKALERDLGTPLFIRHSKGLLPTAPGRALQKHAVRVLQEAKLARESVLSSPGEPSGVLRLGVTETISAYMLPYFFHRRLGALSDIQIEVNEGSIPGIQQRLRNGEIDLGLMVIDNVQPSEDLCCERLFDSPRRLWAPTGHPLLKRAKVKLKEVCDYPFILLEMDEHTATWERYWQHQPCRPHIALRSHSIEAVRSFVGMGHGVTILSNLVFRPWSLDGDHLTRRELAEAVPSMGIGFLYRNDDTVSAVSSFIEYFRMSMPQEAF